MRHDPQLLRHGDAQILDRDAGLVKKEIVGDQQAVGLLRAGAPDLAELFPSGAGEGGVQIGADPFGVEGQPARAQRLLQRLPQTVLAPCQHGDAVAALAGQMAHRLCDHLLIAQFDLIGRVVADRRHLKRTNPLAPTVRGGGVQDDHSVKAAGLGIGAETCVRGRLLQLFRMGIADVDLGLNTLRQEKLAQKMGRLQMEQGGPRLQDIVLSVDAHPARLSRTGDIDPAAVPDLQQTPRREQRLSRPHRGHADPQFGCQLTHRRQATARPLRLQQAVLKLPRQPFGQRLSPGCLHHSRPARLYCVKVCNRLESTSSGKKGRGDLIDLIDRIDPIDQVDSVDQVDQVERIAPFQRIAPVACPALRRFANGGRRRA